MSDDLRTRIAAATVNHADYVSAGIRYCTCGQWDGDSESTRIGFALHVADAVIRELGLRIQVAGPDGIVGTGDYRYVTDFFKSDDQPRPGEGIDLTDDEFNEFLRAAKGEELRITDQGAAVIESGLTVWQAHEIKYGCSRDKPCEKCRSYGTAYTFEDDDE